MNEHALEAYQIGHNDGVKHAEQELYEEMLATLSDIKAGVTDIDHALKLVGIELDKRI